MSAYMGCHMYSGSDEDQIIKPAVDVFEIEDYTAATEWEDFTDQFENILRGWKLSSGSEREPDSTVIGNSRKCDWRTETAHLQYRDFPFVVKYYKHTLSQNSGENKTELVKKTSPEKSSNLSSSNSRVMEDISTGNFDFMCEAKPLPLTMFGLSEMIIISPSGSEILGNETRANQVLGSINIALQNTGCSVPVLVQVMDPKNQLYVGTSLSDNCRLEFSSVLLNKKPMHVSHLSGLLQLFRNRICSPLPVEVSPATVSVRLSYQLEDWASYAWSVDPPDLDLYNASGDTDFIQLSELPLGCVSDPIAGLSLHTTWRDLNEDLIVDNSVHSDLDPLEAPEWSIGITLQSRPECLLAKHVKSVLELCRDTRTSRDVLKDFNIDQEVDGGVQDADRVAGLFDKLSGPQPVPSVSSISQLARQVRPLRVKQRGGGPLSVSLLEHVLGYLFPDASTTNTTNTFSMYKDLSSRSQQLHEYSSTPVKTCPFDGLAWRLSTTVAFCLAWGGGEGVSHLVHEFLLEARYRWEHGISLPGLPPGPPDTGSSLLHQKLQMLNCCIAKRQAKEKYQNSLKEKQQKEKTDWDDSDDEFFECQGEESAEEMEEEGEEEGEETPAWEQAEGRVERLGDLKLINGKAFLYRPVLQEPAPMTEDQLLEQAEVLMQLGSDVAGSEVRARLQSANLLSDMESFKAANPGCVLADFVRWHSPRDWDPNTGLSKRMLASGNMWQELWDQARAVPAHRQKRLFDETREAEKVLQFLTDLGPGDIAHLVLPTLLQAAHLRILSSDENLQCGVQLCSLHSEVVQLICAVSSLPCTQEIRHYRGNIILKEFTVRDSKAWQVVDYLGRCELYISRFMSLRKKFVYDLSVAENEEQEDAVQEMERFVKSLCQEGAEVKVPGAARGPAGRLLQAMFRESNQDSEPRATGLPKPLIRQFVLRCLAGRPLPSSRPTPQRLYARFAPHEFRLNGVYTLDRQYL